VIKLFKLLSHSQIRVHSKNLKSMVVDQNRRYLYSSGDDKIIHSIDLATKKSLGHIKISNGQPNALVLDDHLQRLYCATKEGILLTLDVSGHQITMITYMQLAAQPSPKCENFVKEMNLDTTKNILVCRMKSSRIYCIQLIPRGEFKSTIIERVDTYSGLEKEERDGIHRFQWLSRMSCYCEGTNKGYLKLRDVENAGESLMRLNTTFSDKVCLLDYNRTKNVLFAGCRDGKFMVWKIPTEWRARWVDKKEQDAEFERRTIERERRFKQ